MSEFPYKGYLIRPTPFQLADSGEWSLNICISKHSGDRVMERPFSAGNKFKTEKEAVAQGVVFGKRIIDGQVKDYTVQDM